MRNRRTDLALEARELWQESAEERTRLEGVEAREEMREGIPVTRVSILDRRGEEALGKPAGRYVTLTLDGLARREEGAFGRAARAVAAALGADKLIFLTDTAGVLIDSHNSKTAVPHMDVKRAEELIDTGLIAGGMVPKVRGCIQAIRAGVGEVSILDGRVEHALLLEMLNQRVQGTTITG